MANHKIFTPELPARGAFILRILQAAMVIALVAGSLLPRALKGVTHTNGTPHRFVHMLAFAVTGGLTGLVSRSCARPALLIALGFALEIAQHLFYGGPFEWGDVRDDTAGVVTGLALVAVLVNRWSQNLEPESER